MGTKVKKFKLFDAVLAAVCIVLVVESSAPAAAIGNAQFFWWIFLLLGFFLPYGLISAELGTAYSGDGGIYDWVKRAYGPRWGSRVAWYYYINFPLWMGSLAVLFTDIISQLLGYSIPVYITIPLQLIFIASITLISCTKLSDSKWILNLAAVIKALLMFSIGALGIYFAVRHGSANDFTPSSFLPSFNAEGLSNISVIIFNFLGFEVVTSFASEMSDPKKQIPKALILGGIIIAAFYLLSAFGISVAIPKEELSISSGIIESFILLTGGNKIVVTIFGIMFLYTLAANLLSWSYGVNYVAKYASDDAALPSFLGKSTKDDMPVGASIANGVIAGVIVILAPLIPSEDIFWSFFALNMITLLMSYILMFPTFLKLRRTDPDTERPFKVGGGSLWLRIMTYLPMVLLIISVVLSIIPLDTSSEELGEKMPILIGTIIAVIIGEIIAASAAKKSKNRSL
ncbi:MAG: APC family permease [Clostridia bacterium]|nr:APC family permease [Clostridia bacterium]